APRGAVAGGVRCGGGGGDRKGPVGRRAGDRGGAALLAVGGAVGDPTQDPRGRRARRRRSARHGRHARAGRVHAGPRRRVRGGRPPDHDLRADLPELRAAAGWSWWPWGWGSTWAPPRSTRLRWRGGGPRRRPPAGWARPWRS